VSFPHAIARGYLMARNDTEATAAEEPRTIVYLGNRKAISITPDGDRVAYPGKQCTRVVLRPDASLMEAAQEITSANGLWASHSDADSPAWVAAEGPLADGLVALLAAHYKAEIRDVEHPEPAGV
jgi:hypothetical protein